jgi:hypothetical protein
MHDTTDGTDEVRSESVRVLGGVVPVAVTVCKTGCTIAVHIPRDCVGCGVSVDLFALSVDTFH